MIRPIHLLWMLWLAQAVQGQGLSNKPEPVCASISGDRILGRDLAAVVPQLASLPPDLAVGYSPLPGVRRIFLVRELEELARRHGIEERITTPVCLSWPVHPLTPAVILNALRKSLAGTDAELEIADQCHIPVPEGEVVFPLQGLTAQSARPALWNGYIRYADNRKFTTWVQVRVTVHENRVIAAHAINAGEPIGPADIKTVPYSGPLHSSAVLHKDEDAAGKCAVHSIAAGTYLSETMLALPQDVEKQQLVTVHIRSGATLIETQGIAVESGHRGDVIKIRNPKTGRLFLGQISDRGVVTVVPGGESGLVTGEAKS